MAKVTKLQIPEYLSDVFKALGEMSRLKIYNLLLSNGGNLCVGVIAFNLNMTQPAVSQHLKILKNCGLLTSDRTGSNIHYKVNYEILNEVNEAIKPLIKAENTSGTTDPCKSFPDKSKCK